MIEQLGNGLLLGLIVAIASVSLSLLYGVTRIVNFAHGEIIALGAVLTLFFSSSPESSFLYLDRFSPLGSSFIVSSIASILLCGVFGALLELCLFRPLRKNNYGNVAVLVITIGLSIFLRHIFLLFASAKPASYALDLQKREDYFGIQLTPRNVQVLIIGSVVMILVGLFLTYTKTGRAMRAVRDSSELASVSGINSDYIITLTWIFSSMLAGFTGIIQGVINNVRWNMGFLILLLIFAGSILGGIGTSFGAMFGGFIIGMLVQLSVGLSFMDGHTEAKNAIALALMILILLIRPQGIFGSKESIS